MTDAAITTDTVKTLEDQVVNVTATYDMSHLGLSKADASSVTAKALVNGSPVDSGDTIIGYVTLSAEFANTSLTDLEKTRIEGQSTTFTATPTGHVVLLSSNARTNNSNEIRNGSNNPDSLTVTVAYTSSGFTFSSASNEVSDNKIYFAVEPAYTDGTSGEESEHGSDGIDLS